MEQHFTGLIVQRIFESFGTDTKVTDEPVYQALARPSFQILLADVTFEKKFGEMRQIGFLYNLNYFAATDRPSENDSLNRVRLTVARDFVYLADGTIIHNLESRIVDGVAVITFSIRQYVRDHEADTLMNELESLGVGTIDNN